MYFVSALAECVE